MVVLLPAQIGDTVAVADTVGKEFTVTVTDAVFVQVPSEPVTEYVVVVAGDTE
ncbi:hypothetical protein SDC9_108030 [bioreactor metagenome]|uniref:Uncharacterized protein n=1 Tax=bioreactor metagenome TaxID=1076179 RepID=A0A645BHE9_9ZZZZ